MKKCICKNCDRPVWKKPGGPADTLPEHTFCEYHIGHVALKQRDLSYVGTDIPCSPLENPCCAYDGCDEPPTTVVEPLMDGEESIFICDEHKQAATGNGMPPVAYRYFDDELILFGQEGANHQHKVQAFVKEHYPDNSNPYAF